MSLKKSADLLFPSFPYKSTVNIFLLWNSCVLLLWLPLCYFVPALQDVTPGCMAKKKPLWFLGLHHFFCHFFHYSKWWLLSWPASLWISIGEAKEMGTTHDQRCLCASWWVCHAANNNGTHQWTIRLAKCIVFEMLMNLVTPKIILPLKNKQVAKQR